MALDTQPEPYEPPKIEHRDRIAVPLIGISGVASAAFRPTMAYEPPKIEQRENAG